jgi:hypothetical protein
MERKMNGRGKAVALQVFFVLAVTCQARATVVNWNSIEVNDVEYYVQTDKAVYDLAENVEIQYRVTNLRDEEWRFSYIPPIMDIIVEAEDGENYNEIWHWSWDKTYPAGPVVFQLGPNESTEISGIWPQIDLNGSVEIEDHTQVPPGIYRCSGIFYPTHSRVAVNITVVPEPGSLTLFVAGLYIVHHFNKKRRS